MMSAQRLRGPRVCTAFPAGTVLRNPVTGEYVRVLEHRPERVVGELLAEPGGAVAGPHLHPRQVERFEVLAGTMSYRRGGVRGLLSPGEAVTVPPGVVHDWWNGGSGLLRARVTVTPPGAFMAMIASVYGLATLGRTDRRGMPVLLDAALLAEAFGDEIVFERPPLVLQRALAGTVAPLARLRGRSVTADGVLRAAVVDPESWPLAVATPHGGQALG